MVDYKYIEEHGNQKNDNRPKNNNVVLYHQLKAAIVAESFPKDLSRNKEGCLKFSIRSGQLAINHIVREKKLCPETLKQDVDQDTKSIGLSRSGLKTLLMILEGVLKEFDPIDHATLYIYYWVGDDGEYKDGKLVVEEGIHHPRY
jgi:hypothetical protein